MTRRPSLIHRVRASMRAVLLVALCALVSSHAMAVDSGDSTASPASVSTVVLISIDGTRPDDLREDTLPSLVALAKRGAIARGLVSSTPSNTFPSHVTLVTGVEPNRHGMVNNFFIDPERGAFRKQDVPSWIDVEPLWSYLAGRGIVSASFHWVGSEGPWKDGRGPRDWEPFDPSTPPVQKVEKILEWLDLEGADRRPRFITSWFPGADHAAHLAGPGHATAIRQLARQESAFAALIAGIDRRGLWPSTTLIVVSDHGMAAADRLLDFDALVREAGIEARVTGMGGFASVYLEKPRGRDDRQAELASVEQVIELATDVGLEAIAVKHGDPNAEFSHPRFGDVVVFAPIGTAIHRPGLPSGGFHGYRPREAQMHGVFVAAGRGVGVGIQLPLLQSTEIAPTVLRLLGVASAPWMSGSAIRLDPAEAQH